MNKVRLGIVGAGWVVRSRHLVALSGMTHVEVSLIWSRDAKRAREVALQFGIPKVTDRWEEVVQSPDVDAVIVATPPILHQPVTIAALSAGKHVLCQGRMARNLKEAQDMVRAAAATRLITALYPPRPGLKGDRVMHRLLHKEKFVGEIREVRVTGMGLEEDEGGYQWTEDPDVMGVNTMTLGMWAEVLNRWVGPATRVVAVATAHKKHRKTSEGKDTRAVIPDSLAVAAELECGATATYHLSSRAAFGPGHSIEIYGSLGALVYTLFTEEIRGASAAGQQWQPIVIPSEEERLHSTDAEFVQAIRGGGKVSPNFAEGLLYMQFCEAVAQSVRSNRAVSVPPRQATMLSWGQGLGVETTPMASEESSSPISRRPDGE